MRALRFLALLCLALLAVALASASAATAAGSADIALPQPQVEAVIELRHPAGLDRFVHAVSDPASPRYRRYASVEALVDRFGASPETRGTALRWLRRNGLHGSISPTGTFVTATLPRRLAGRLLPRVGGASASGSGGGRLRRRVPMALRGAVRRVALLGTRPALTHFTATAGAAAARAVAATASAGKKQPYRSILPHSGTAEGCAAGSSGGVAPGFEPFTPNQYLTAYGHRAMHERGLRGEGQTVAVVETGGFRRSDIVAFDRCFGSRTPPTRAVPVLVKGPQPPEDEATLDLSMLSVGAPKLDRILVYEGPESLGGVALATGAALGSPGHRPDVISISLGFCEPELSGELILHNAFDNLFAIAAGAGISVLVSSGDQGSSGCRAANAEDGETTALPLLAVSLPASSPYATAVGGTNLELSKSNRIKQEIVWNDFPIQAGGGGGGTSIVTPQTPWWQRRVHRYGLGRKVPDISALADIFPGYAFFCTAEDCEPQEDEVFGWSSIGGTSAAAPLMAAGIALADQYAAQRGQAPLGFLNPLLYRLGAEARTRKQVFTDVVKGDDDIGRVLPADVGGGRPLGCCSARRGYDLASGWGSLKMLGFARAAAAAAP